MSTYSNTDISDEEYELVERAWTLNLMGMSTYQIGRELDLELRRVEQYIALRRSMGPRRRQPRPAPPPEPPQPRLPDVPHLSQYEAQGAVEHFSALVQAAQAQADAAHSAGHEEEAEKAFQVAQQAYMMMMAFRKQLDGA